MVLGGPRARRAAARRLQRAVQQPRAARLQQRRRAAGAARPRAQRSRRARTSAPRSRGSSPSRPSACSTRSAPARRPRWSIGASELRRLGLVPQAGRRGPEPHARAVQPRVAADLPAGPGARRLRRGSRRRAAPAVRRARRRERLGRGHHDPLRVRAACRSAPTPRPPTSASRSRQLREMLRPARRATGGADGQADREARSPAASNSSSAKLDAPQRPRLSLRGDRDRLPAQSTRRTSTRTSRPSANIRDAAIAGSKRATDLHMKLEYLRARHGGHGSRRSRPRPRSPTASPRRT